MLEGSECHHSFFQHSGISFALDNFLLLVYLAAKFFYIRSANRLLYLRIQRLYAFSTFDDISKESINL